MSGWQDIATAPIEPFNPGKWYMNHSPSLLLWAGCVVVGSYGFTRGGKGRWRDHHSTVEPTHWMPLPEAPTKDQSDAG